MRGSLDFPLLQQGSFAWATEDGAKGFTCVGVPVGTEEYIDLVLTKQVNRIHNTVQRVEGILMPVSQQNYYAVLVQSLNKQFGYTLACLPPKHTQPHSRRLDAIMLASAKKAFGITETRLHRWALTRMRLAAKRGGTALVSHVATAPQAHLAMIHRVAPLLVGYVNPVNQYTWTGILPPESSDKWRTNEATFAPGSVTHRFEAVIDNDPAGVGTRIKQLWNEMQQATKDTAGPLSEEAKHMGMNHGGLCDKLQHKITTQRQDSTFNALQEEVRAVRLKKQLPQRKAECWDVDHPQETEFRPDEYDTTRVRVAVASASMTAHNKYTQQLCNGRPATEALTAVSNDTFSNVARRYLALPDVGSKQLAESQIKTPRGIVVDEYACAIVDCNAWGVANSNWKRRHDMAEHTVMHLARQYGYRLRRQVLNVFAGCVPSEARGRFERDPQCMIVDTINEMRATNGLGTLGDFKTIQNPIGQAMRGGGYTKQDWTPLEARQKAVNTTAKQKAKNQDRRFNNASRDQVGPIQRRLQRLGTVEGYVVGPYGGVSPHLAKLVCLIAKHGATAQYRDMGLADPSEAFPIIYTRCLRVVGISNQVAFADMVKNMIATARRPREARQQATARRNHAQRQFERTVAEEALRAGWQGAMPHGIPDTWTARGGRTTKVGNEWVYMPI